jgi:hypothetical protein
MLKRIKKTKLEKTKGWPSFYKGIKRPDRRNSTRSCEWRRRMVIVTTSTKILLQTNDTRWDSIESKLLYENNITFSPLFSSNKPISMDSCWQLVFGCQFSPGLDCLWRLEFSQRSSASLFIRHSCRMEYLLQAQSIL